MLSWLTLHVLLMCHVNIDAGLSWDKVRLLWQKDEMRWCTQLIREFSLCHKKASLMPLLLRRMDGALPSLLLVQTWTKKLLACPPLVWFSRPRDTVISIPRWWNAITTFFFFATHGLLLPYTVIAFGKYRDISEWHIFVEYAKRRHMIHWNHEDLSKTFGINCCLQCLMSCTKIGSLIKS